MKKKEKVERHLNKTEKENIKPYGQVKKARNLSHKVIFHYIIFPLF